jgi:ribose transport system substrate-binding protein
VKHGTPNPENKGVRTTVLTAAVVATLGMLFPIGLFAGGQKEPVVPITLAVSFSTSSGSSQQMFQAGAESYAKIMGLPSEALAADPDSQKQLASIKAEIARTGGYVVFFVDPANPAAAVTIARTMEAGVYWASGGPRPADAKVWEYPHWVAHISFDGFAAGVFTATELIKTFNVPGQGRIIALQGRLDDAANAERWQGLQKVLTDNPGIQLIQGDPAQGDRTKAYEETRALLAANPDVDGIWAENDEMAMGAIQALREAGLAVKVKAAGCDGTPEMLNAIKAGLAAATVLNDGKYLAELCLAMALAAKQGKLDVASLPHEHRMFEVSGLNISAGNVDQMIHDYIDNTPLYDLTSFFARWSVALE